MLNCSRIILVQFFTLLYCIIIIIIIIATTMFMVLSSWQSHFCESSPGSFDEYRMAPSGH